ncbi:hypothetical protein JCM3770_005589 [Rhodotorula araucariae]
MSNDVSASDVGDSKPPPNAREHSRPRSYSSVIHFDRPESIHLDPLPGEKKPLRSSSSRWPARTSRSSAREAAEETGASRNGRRQIDFKVIFVALMLLATVTSLDNTTVYQFISYATSSFAEHSALGIIQTTAAIAVAVSRPLITKESLIVGLGWSFLVAIVFYAVGYAVIAASPTIMVYAAGTVVAQLGIAALFSLQGTAILRYSPSLANNALLNSLLTTPYYVTGWIGSYIVDAVLAHASWRWGYGMFCIMTPVLVVPLLILLFIDERRKNRSPSPSSPLPPPSPTQSIICGTAPLALPSRRTTLKTRAKALVSEQTHAGRLDAVGILLLALALTGLLLPLTLVSRGTLAAASAPFLVPIATGALALALLLVHERRAACPLFPLRVFRTRAAAVCLAATVLNMTSFNLLLAFQYSFIQVMFPTWSPLLQGFFAFSEQFTLMIAHLAVSFPVKAVVRQQTAARAAGTLERSALLRRPMWWTAGGHAARVAGVGLMILSRGIDGPVWLLVLSQVIHGAGGAVASVFCAQVAMAAAPTRDDVNMVSALIFLLTDTGNAIGTAVATLLWQRSLPNALTAQLASTLSAAEIAAVFRSTEQATAYPVESAASRGIRSAYAAVMRLLLYVALGLAIASFGLSCAMGLADVSERDLQCEGNQEGADASAPKAHALGKARRYDRWAREPAGSDWSDE